MLKLRPQNSTLLGGSSDAVQAAVPIIWDSMMQLVHAHFVIYYLALLLSSVLHF